MPSEMAAVLSASGQDQKTARSMGGRFLGELCCGCLHLCTYLSVWGKFSLVV